MNPCGELVSDTSGPIRPLNQALTLSGCVRSHLALLLPSRRDVHMYRHMAWRWAYEPLGSTGSRAIRAPTCFVAAVYARRVGAAPYSLCLHWHRPSVHRWAHHPSVGCVARVRQLGAAMSAGTLVMRPDSRACACLRYPRMVSHAYARLVNQWRCPPTLARALSGHHQLWVDSRCAFPFVGAAPLGAMVAARSSASSLAWVAPRDSGCCFSLACR